MPCEMSASLHIALLALLFGVTTLPAQSKTGAIKSKTQSTTGPKPPAQQPPQLDPVAAKTLAKWATLEDRKARNAIRAIEFDIAVESTGGMTGTWRAKSRFKLDKRTKFPTAELEWDDKDIATALKRRNWVAGTFANDYRDDEIAHQLAGAKVKSTVRKNGTILTAKGGRINEETFLVFDKAGVLVATMVGPLRKRFYYEQRNNKFVRNGETYELPNTFGDVTITVGLVGKYYIPTKVHEIVKVQGRVLSDITFTFTNHTVNAPKAPAPQNPGKQKGAKNAG